MHYYQFHIGDYKSHTHHLTVIEDIAYRRLLDHYYLHESPIKQRDIARQIVMREHEQEVFSVLSEFFVSTEQGFINPRADAEIKNYREHQAKSAYGALVRDNPTFKSLVHMDKFIKCYLDKTHLEYVTSCTHHVPIKNPLAPLDATTNHEPLTINQEKATHSFFESEELNDVFSKWLYACANEVKPMVRKAHGQSAIEALAMKLNRMPVDKAIRQVRQSLENGWVTLRPVEDLQNGREFETEADRAAREFMETVKAYNTHKTLYGEESANEKFNMTNGNVQSSIDNKRIA